MRREKGVAMIETSCQATKKSSFVNYCNGTGSRRPFTNVVAVALWLYDLINGPKGGVGGKSIPRSSFQSRTIALFTMKMV